MMQYEEQRMIRIEENKKRMKELGIPSMAYETMSLKDQNKRKKNKKKKSNETLLKDVEYIFEEELEVSSEEDDNGSMQNRRSLRPRSKKVMAPSVENLVESADRPQDSTTSMSSMLNKRSQEQQRKNKETQRKVLTPLHHQAKQLGQEPSQLELQQKIDLTIPQQEKEVQSNTSKKHGLNKTMVAPGSLGAYVRLKEKSREQLSRQTHASLDDSIQLRYDLPFTQVMENSKKQRASYSGLQLVDENEYSESSDDDAVFEKQKIKHPDDSEYDAAKMINELAPAEEHTNDQPVSKKLKRTRGPSMCKDVHGRSIEDRKPIILNDLCQPIGPDSSTLDEFSRFLGSVARNSNLVPLNKLDWHQVPCKDQIWEYVKKKYMIAEEGRGYVLRSVATLWRIYKSRIKKKHFKAYDNMRDRWTHRPKSIPDSHFRELLQFWSLKEVQELSEKNKEISESQTDRHTTGPVSFARKRYELEKSEKKPPSEATLYRETRQRKPGRKYKTSCEMEDVQTQKNRKLSGRCTTTKRVKGNSESNMLIPEEFLQPYKTSIVKDTFAEVLKNLQQVLPCDVLARITPSFKDPLNYLVSGQSSSGINDLEQCQNDENGDRANDDDAPEKNDKRIEDEVQDEDL